MNKNKVFGYCRDKLFLEVVDKFKCLDAEQLQILLFNSTCNPQSAKRQCQSRGNKLAKSKLVKRSRMNLDEPFKYYNKDFAQKEHITLLNWMLIRLLLGMKYDRIYYMEYQRDYGVKIPDLFIVTQNYVTKQYRALFLEMDNTITNKFDAVEKYNKLYKSKPCDEFVTLTAPHFPKIIIATTDTTRLDEINRNIMRNNKHNLNFQTDLIWNIKEECKDAQIKNIRDKFVTDTHQLQISLR